MNAKANSRYPTSRFGLMMWLIVGLMIWLGLASVAQAAGPPACARNVTANIVAIDQPVMFNRMGASNINAMIFALERDVINTGLFDANGEAIFRLRPDKRPRPLVLRIRVGDCLTINLRNGLRNGPVLPGNPNQPPIDIPPQFNTPLDEQVADRHVSLHVNGLQWVNGPEDDGSYVGNNTVAEDGTVARGDMKPYVLYAEREGAYAARGLATTVGSDANQGNSSNLLFGEVIVEPAGSAIYRGQVAEEEMRLAADWDGNGMINPFNGALSPCSAPPALPCNEQTADGHPIINYEAVYPNSPPWSLEDKGNLPVLNMINLSVTPIEIVHSEINAFVGYGPSGTLAPAPDGPYVGRLGHFPKGTYPLESMNKRNPTVPNRLEPFRDFASVFHDEPATKQAFPGFYEKASSPVFSYVLEGVKDGFMINYGSGGIGSEIIANRLHVGPMHDCLSCAFEEFFLTSFTVSDPATLVDVPANAGLEGLLPGQNPGAAAGPKATKGLYTEDPANIHHSYTGDFAKFRNVHIGKEQHVFHLHNHQWLYNPNDDNSNYLDAQGIGPGTGYTYEINFGGSGNRNKTSGDSIYHCHFYPHFAQGMWYHWRHHDVFEAGTKLQTTLDGVGGLWHEDFISDPDGLGLGDGTPAAGARALPDGEVAVGVPIPAVVPLPGKPMAPMPLAGVTVGPNPLMTTASDEHLTAPGAMVPVGSLAVVPRPATTNPGFPFWVAGIEDVVGQRPPTPPLDMLTSIQAGLLNDAACQADPNCLWRDIDPAQADGWDGGLPRGALQGYAAGGQDLNVVTRLDFSKTVEEAQGVFYPEEGTDLEQLAMDYHSVRNHPTCLPDGTCDSLGTPVKFVLNGNKPAVGAPFHEPCIDDEGVRLVDATGGNYHFFGATGLTTEGSSVFNATTPRIYKGVNIQYDAVFNKAGYHYPQQRIITLWQDAVPVITKEKAGQPMLLRLNTFDCAVYHHTNLVPEVYEVDDYQVRTPTDIIGQHIHLPKWDLTTADGAANGWNYEDGTLSPGAVQERIRALNCFANGGLGCPGLGGGSHLAGTGSGGLTPPTDLSAAAHPYFSAPVAPGELQALWMGARTTTQRWFADPVVNTDGMDRGLGIIFSHDHYGPSTHQQIGLYATVLAEPAGSTWVHNETGDQLGDVATYGDGGRFDGGPTAWQAAILPPASAPNGTTVKAEELQPYREFYVEYSDFQHAYEAGVYVGAGHLGEPLGEPTPGVETPVYTLNGGPLSLGNPDWDGTAANAFRFAINPPARAQITPVFPELVLEVAGGGLEIPGCAPARPCPQAIDVQDPGMLVVNYRNEPVGLRIYDPNKIGPDGKLGMQADGPAGDLAFALANKDSAGNDIIRKFEVSMATSNLGTTPPPIGPGGGFQVLNYQPKAGQHINGTVFPPPLNSFPSLKGGDPFTPMLRTMAGDTIRFKMQAGAHEEEHDTTIHGVKWLQTGSGHGKGPNSGWRNAQAGGISEQFTLAVPVVGVVGQTGQNVDYAYSVNASANDGWFSGMWGIMRVYGAKQNDLYMLPTSASNARIGNANEFSGACPAITTKIGKGKGAQTVTTVENPRPYDVTAVLANEVLPVNGDVTIQDLSPLSAGAPTDHIGNHALNAAGGTLIYNPRTDAVTDGVTTHNGPIHDPTAILYVRTADLVFDTACLATSSCRTELGDPIGLQPGTPIEPLILRAAAGECLLVTLRNALPPLTDVVVPVIDPATGQPVQVEDPPASGIFVDLTETVQNATMPDLATYSTMMGVVKRDRLGDPLGSTTFQTNLMRPSGYVGLHPQLVEFDGSRDNGILVGTNSNTGNQTLTPPGSKKTYTWYAGHIGATLAGGKKPTFTLVDTAVELGGSNLQPTDQIKQGMKSLVGQLVVEPAGSTWNEDTDDATGRQTATVSAPGGSFRDFSAVFTKGLTHYYADSSAVEHLNGEGVGLPEDSQEASGMALNYGIEPLWFRLNIMPNAPFGNAGSGLSTFGGVDQHDVFSNAKVGGDPATPVFTVAQNQSFRMRVTNPFGTSRGTTFQLNGYVWPRDPYVCPGSAHDALPGKCATTEVGSTAIGNNPVSFYQGGQESITPATHFDIVPTSSGLPGDHLFRDGASFGNASGLWGIVRVTP